MDTDIFRPKIVFVDDEASVLKSLNRIFYDTDYDIHTFDTAETALERIAALEPDIVVSDQMMPGMKGLEFLERAYELSPISNFVMLTAFPEYNLVTNALNEGNICRFLTKPWMADEFRSLVEQILLERSQDNLLSTDMPEGGHEENLRTHIKFLRVRVKQRIQSIMAKNQELFRANASLERNLWDTIRIFFSLLEKKSDYVGRHSVRVSMLVRGFARHLNSPLKDITELEIAALLHDIGKIALPDSVIARIQQGLHRSDEQLLRLHPLIGQYSFYNIAPLRKIGLYIRSHHEKWSGDGFPDKLEGKDIPAGVQLIQVCNYYDNLQNARFKYHPSKQEQIIKNLRMEAGKSLSPEYTGKFLIYLKQLEKVRKVDENTNVNVPYDVQELMDMAITRLNEENRKVAEGDVVISTSYEDIPEIVVQPRKIMYAFMNILRNAVESINNRGYIRIEIDFCDGYARIAIQDTGIGIPEEMVNKIFDPGYSTKKDKKHKGQGLSEVYDAIRHHKGKAELKSTLGKGTLFIIHLPVKS